LLYPMTMIRQAARRLFPKRALFQGRCTAGESTSSSSTRTAGVVRTSTTSTTAQHSNRSNTNTNTLVQYIAYAAFMATATTNVTLNERARTTTSMENPSQIAQNVTPPSSPQLLLQTIADDKKEDSFLRQCHEQGPCNALFYKLEECTVTEKKTKNCMETAQKFESCWKKHPNLYVLIALSVNQEVIREKEMEYDMAGKPRVPWRVSPTIDFSQWNKFIAANRDKHFVEWLSLDKTMPLWKRFDVADQGDPTLVPVRTVVPTTITQNNANGAAKLTCCYAVDQDNLVIGYAAVTSDDAGRVHKELQISVLPAQTKTIRVLGFYESSAAAAPSKTVTTTLRETPSFLVPHSLAPKDQK